MKHLLPLLLALVCTSGARAENWSYWRGPGQDGVSPDTDLPEKFSADPKAAGSNVLWRVPYGGSSTPIVQNGRVYLITRTGEATETRAPADSPRAEQPAPNKPIADKPGEGVHQQEQVLCFDAKTGDKLWQQKFNVWHTGMVRDRLGLTMMVGDPETGNVYAHGTQGLLLCFNRDGKILWQHSLTEEYGRISGYGGRLASPVVDEGLVIVSMLNASWGDQTVGGTRLVAFDKRNGNVVWWASTGYRPSNTYSSVPVVAVINGQRLILTGGGDGGVHAFKVRTGEKVWSYILGSGSINGCPVVEGDRVYAAHGEDNPDGTQGRVVCLDAGEITEGKPKLVWQYDGIKAKFASPILHGGRLYVCDEIGRLYCLDAKTKKLHWRFKYGKNTKGSPLLGDGKIYVTEVDSKFHILRPGDRACKELHATRFPPVGGVPVELNGSPAIADGRVYFQTTTHLYCVGAKDWKGKVGKARSLPAEAARGATAAHLQVVPADVMITPGESREFRARTFDVNGRLLGDVKVNDWKLAGPLPPKFPIGFPKPPPRKPPTAEEKAALMLKGKLTVHDGTAKFLAPRTPPGQSGRLVAKQGKLTAEVRVRVAPVPPYAPDFDAIPVGQTPGGWVNCQGKFSVIQLKDGHKVLKKRNDNANILVARSNAFIGLPYLTDYTIQCDLRGVPNGSGDIPDMGIGANRYTFLLEGKNQQLRLVSWDAQRRVDRTIPWEWKGDVWLRMKLRVDVQGNKALVRGKLWPRDAREPEKWTLEFTDPTPNVNGSPTLYGFAYGRENDLSTVYYTNLRITSNKPGRTDEAAPGKKTGGGR